MPLDGYDVVDGIVAYTCKQREQATGRLRVKGSVAHVVWCDVSKSKQKDVLLKSGAVLIKIIIWLCGFGCFLGCLAGLLMMMMMLMMLVMLMLLMLLWHIHVDRERAGNSKA